MICKCPIKNFKVILQHRNYISIQKTCTDKVRQKKRKFTYQNNIDFSYIHIQMSIITIADNKIQLSSSLSILHGWIEMKSRENNIAIYFSIDMNTNQSAPTTPIKRIWMR